MLTNYYNIPTLHTRSKFCKIVVKVSQFFYSDGHKSLYNEDASVLILHRCRGHCPRLSAHRPLVPESYRGPYFIIHCFYVYWNPYEKFGCLFSIKYKVTM